MLAWSNRLDAMGARPTMATVIRRPRPDAPAQSPSVRLHVDGVRSRRCSRLGAGAADGLGRVLVAGARQTFGIIPVLDLLVGSRSSDQSAATLETLEDDPLYRWATHLYLPAQYLS